MTIYIVHRNDLASGDYRHDRQVPDLDDVRHRLPVYGRALPDHREERCRRNGFDFCQDWINVCTLHR
jgi:hypothetical protein